MDISKVKALVFDCDGVMFDTAESNRRFYNEVLKAFGKPELTREQFIMVHMMTVKAAVNYLFPEMDDPLPVYAKVKEIGYGKFTPFMQMEPGLVELLAAAKSRGLIRGVATNRMDTMPKVLETYELTDQFEIVVTALDVKHPKPAPDQLEKIMSVYGLSAEEIVFVGDSEYDEQAARAAGTFFIAFKQPRLRADIHAESMQEIAELLG